MGHIGDTILSITGGFLGIAGVLLNLSVTYTVLQMGAHVDRDSVGTAWEVARDFANIGFIFILLFIGFATILRIERYGYKALLAKLVVVALLINFSLFFTSVIIDVSNIFAVGIYKQMSSQSADQVVFGDCDTLLEGAADAAGFKACFGQGIAGSFMHSMGLVSIYNVGEAGSLVTEARANETLSGNNILFVAILGSMFILTAAFIFFSVAILLIIRFIILVFLMILSPFAFVGMILPQTAGASARWWRTLFSQAFFAPLFFLLVFMSLTFINKIDILGDATGTSFANALINKDIGSMQIFLSFSIAAGFLLASLIIAKQLAGSGSRKALSIANKFAGRRLSGATAAGLRGTVGLASYAAANSKFLKDQAKKGGVGGFAARQAMRVTGAASRASFDARATALGKKAGLGKAGGKGGFEEGVKAAVKRKTQFGRKIGEESPGERKQIQETEQQIRNTTNLIEDLEKRGATGAATIAKKQLKELTSKLNKSKGAGKARREKFAETLERGATGAILARNAEKKAAEQIRKGKPTSQKIAEWIKDNPDAMDQLKPEAAEGGVGGESSTT